MKPYSSYKPSGVPWLGDVPSHWDVLRIKEVSNVIPSNVDKLTVEGQAPVRLCNYVDVYKNERITSGIEFMWATATSEQVERLALRVGDVVVTKDSESPWDIAVPTVVADAIECLVCGYHLTKLEPTDIEGQFLAWALRAYQVNLHFALSAGGITRYGLSSSSLADGNLPRPPSDEQQAIADYLDTETARIDELIREKEGLIGLLGEARRSFVSSVLSGDSLPGSPSSNEWAPHLPSGWQIKRLKHLAQVRSGIAKGKDTEGRQTIELPYLRVANVQDGHLDLDVVSTIEVDANAVERFTLQPGDVLMNEGGDYDKLGRGALWSGEVSPCLHQNHVFAVRPVEEGLSEWLAAITQTRYAKFYFMNNAKQSTNLASISQTNIKELPVLLPPKKVRDVLLAKAGEEARAIAELIAHTRDEMLLLKELRAATIAEAVLGRIDLRTASAAGKPAKSNNPSV